MSSDAKLVVVIPTKNRRALLERALASVFSQAYRNYRIVVVNDGSTDDTRTYLSSLDDPRIMVVHYERSRGVNAARNAAFQSLAVGEWAIPLDDDDTLLPGALETITRTISETPDSIQMLCFNTHIQKPDGESIGGREFFEGEKWYDPTYEAIMTGEGLRTKGDNRMVLKWTLFPRYLFSEDINGFEGEWMQLVARDAIGIRYFPSQTHSIDLVHAGEHLSNVASRRDPGAFARAHARIFHEHARFYAAHPALLKEQAWHAAKVAVRAMNPVLTARFVCEYLHAQFRLAFLRGSIKKCDADHDIHRI